MKKALSLLLPIFLWLPLQSQTNIAPLASQLLTSYVSPWEDLYAINNGIDPESSADKTGGAYGNWSGTNNTWQWVEYYWDSFYMISRSDIYWWADGQGILIPSDTYLEYWDFRKKDWSAFAGLTGNGKEADQYNETTFTPVLTNRVRVYMISSIATGILEWKIWGSAWEQLPTGSGYETDHPLTPGSATQVVIWARDENENPVENYTFYLSIKVSNELAANEEAYIINGQACSGDQEIALAPTSSYGETLLNITLPEVIDPMDGIRLQLCFNDRYTTLGDSLYYIAPGLTPPQIDPDLTDNTADHDLELTFTDDSAWRSAFKAAYADGSLLLTPDDYSLLPGTLVLKPQAGNPILSSAGTKTLLIQATGYEPVQLQQSVLPGTINPEESRITTRYKLYAPTATDILIELKDSYKNAVPGARVNYHASVRNLNPATAENYSLDGTAFSSDLSGQTLLLSDGNGILSLPLRIPHLIDKGDGMVIHFSLQDGTPLSDTVCYFNDGTDKEIVLQQAVRTNSGFSWDRTTQSDNFIVYWGQKIAGDPTDAVNGAIRFDPQDVLAILESILSYFVDSLDFIDNPDTLNMAKYKHEVVMNETWESGFTGWAFGGSADGRIGGMWIHPQATSGGGVLSHEFTHMCQAMVMLQYPGYGLNASYAGFFWESHANFMMKNFTGNYLGVQPERYIWTAMMQYSTTRRHYQNIYFLDYLTDKYGLETVHDIWRKASPVSSHPLTSLRDSVLRYGQDDLNDDFAYHAMKNVSWDYSQGDKIRKAIAAVDPMYIQRLYTIPDTVAGGNGLYIVPEYLAPGDYGYNIIPLFPEGASGTISLSFAGLENVSAGGAGWRYGFVATDREGRPRYSDLYRGTDETAEFAFDLSDSLLFLVVTGAPQKHHNYPWEPGFPKVYRYPYTFRLTGALPAGYKSDYNNLHAGTDGALHANGGGWVASTARVDATAYVGPDAQVLGKAVVSGNARIEDFAVVTDNSQVLNDAVVKDHAIVGRGSVVKDRALVEKTARVYDYSTISDSAVVTGSALIYRSQLKGMAVARDLAILMNSQMSGTSIVGGDAEEYDGCSSGTYLQFTRNTSCDGMILHPLNNEVNPVWEEYFYPLGERPEAPLNLNGSALNSSQILLTWDRARDLQGEPAYYVFVDGNLHRTVTETSAIITDLAAGTSYSFAVKALDRSGNTSQLSRIIEVTTSPEGEEPQMTEDWTVYPNPAGDQLHIVSPFMGSTVVQILDMSGKEVYRTEISEEGTLQLSAKRLAGPHLIRLSSGDRSVSKIILLR